MCKNVKKTMILGRIDDLGRLSLTSSQMKRLNFVEGETVSLDFNDEGIIIAKSLGYSLAYDRIKVMPNGVLIGKDICGSKLLMTEERRVLENIKTKVFDEDGAYLREDKVLVTYYNVDYRINNDRVVIPLTDEQQKAELRIIRTVDELGRIIIPCYLRKLHNLHTEAGIEIRGNNIVISNAIERKTKVDELGRIVIPKDILNGLEIKFKTELEVETSGNVILSIPETPILS